MSDRNIGRDILKDYIPVHERIEAFYAKHPEGTLQAEIIPELTTESRITMRAYAYRTPDDARPGMGYSWLAVPGPTPYTRGSEIENCETSAWGRAIASLGFLVKRGIATAEEVESKRDAVAEATRGIATAHHPAEPASIRSTADDVPAPLSLGPAEREGAVVVKSRGPADGLLRTGPDGGFLVFALELGDGKHVAQVVARGALATDILDATGGDLRRLAGQKVLVEGELWRNSFKKEGRLLAYQRMELARIETSEWTLPTPDLIPEGEDEEWRAPEA